VEVIDMNDPTTQTDVIVVGAGLAGLAAAATAARRGAAVVVLDSRRPGGRARSIERNGFVLNEGAHALYRHGAGARVLSELGVAFTGSQPDPKGYRTWWNGALAPLPVTPAGLLGSPLLGVRSKATAARLLGDLGRLARNAPPVTFAQWLDDHGARPDLATLLTTLARLSTYAADPGGLPAPAMLRQLAMARGGVWYLDGGWQRLVDGLLAAAAASGAVVHPSSSVTALERDDGRWVATVAGTGDTPGSVAAPAVVERLVGGDWVAPAGPPVRAACLDLGLDSPPPVEFLLSADDPCYLSVHGPLADLTPTDQHLVSLLRYLGPDEPSDRATAREDLERHARRAGVSTDATGRTMERFLAASPVAWGSPTMHTERPRGDEFAAQGVHVAGDWVGDHLLADAALHSGARAGEAAANRARLQPTSSRPVGSSL